MVALSRSRREGRVVATVLAGTLLLTGCSAAAAPEQNDLDTWDSAAWAGVPDARYLYWPSMAARPSKEALRAAAGRYRVAMFNSDRADIATELRRLDPDVVILCYLDLASVRSYDTGPAVTGVPYRDAVKNGWLARNTAGKPIEWRQYPKHWLTTTWDPGYQEAWLARAREVLEDPVWDGILADNDMRTLSHYSADLLDGTTDRAATDRQIRDGASTLIKTAGPALNALGKMLVVNVSDGRLDASRWGAHSWYGGAFEENFMAWSKTDRQPQVWDWGADGWSGQRALIASGPRSLAMTSGNPDDRRTLVYGYATFLLDAGPTDAWSGPLSTDDQLPPLPPEALLPIGPPVSGATEVNGATVRTFRNGWVAVNPTPNPLEVTAPPGVTDVTGRQVTTRTLPSRTAFVGKR